MDTTTRTRTVVGVFDDYDTARRAASELTASGFTADEVQVSAASDYRFDTAHGNTGLTGNPPSDRSGGGISGFFRRLFGDDVDEQERGVYAEAVRRGGAVVAVTTDDHRQDRAADILNQYGAVDIDTRVASWRERGYSGYDASAGVYSDEEIAREREHYNRGEKERTVPVVNEELRVGKRAVQRGGVRVYNRVQEHPVEQEVQLREEHVRVDRRATDRPATDADFRQHDEVIEVTEMAEEPVVEKRTRVVEEVVVGKETSNRKKTVRDTVRRSDVTVEHLGGESAEAGYDEDFRTHFKSRFGSNRSAKYDSYAPAYQYGYRMASDPNYRGRRWEDVESTFRTDYERSYPGSKWEQMKDAVRYGWERVTNRT